MKFHAMKKGIAVLLIAVFAFSSTVSSACAATKYNGSRTVTDVDKSFSTIGTLTDSTTLNISMSSWWYSKSNVKSKGVSKFVFDKKSTKYGYELKSHTISLSMSGIALSATFSGSPSVSATIKDGVATYSCEDAYWSYSFTTSARCWTGSYTQESYVQYRIKSGNSAKGTVSLNTEIEW